MGAGVMAGAPSKKRSGQLAIDELRDIAEKLHDLERAELAEQRLYRAFGERVAALFAYIDSEGIYRFASQSHEDFFKRPLSAIVGRHYRDVAGQQAAATLAPFVERVLGGDLVLFERAIQYDEMPPRVLQVIYIPDRDNGNVRGFFAITIDITDHRGAAKTCLRADCPSRVTWDDDKPT